MLRLISICRDGHRVDLVIGNEHSRTDNRSMNTSAASAGMTHAKGV